MSKDQNFTCTVYGLREAGQEIRYIGQTRYDLPYRLAQHYATAKKGAKTPKNTWLLDAKANGRIIEIFPLEENAEWCVAERKWISHYREIHKDLLNVDQRERWEDDNYREERSAAMKAVANTPEGKKVRSEIQKAAWQREDVRAARLAKRGETVKTEEFREKMRASATKQMSDPEMVDRISRANRERLKDPEQRAIHAENARAGWADPVKRESRIQAIKAAWAAKKKQQPEIPGL